jgi:3',5'-cyclic AMP phosphodiesterase CpdA
MSVRPSQAKFSRREWLGYSAGALLSLGLWPGCARFSDNGRGGNFSFVVVNDTHYQSEKCGVWFERVAFSIKSQNPRPEFCLMVGDLAEHGTTDELGAMRDALHSFGTPYHAVIGNHDYASPIDRRSYEELYPRSVNYHFVHRGWQFIGLDSSEAMQYRNTRIQPATFQWLDQTLPKLNRAQPTVVFTHFPLGAGVLMRPMNADDLLARFLEFNLVAVYNGHFHGFTERTLRQTVLTTNKCCAISRANHDGTKEKGYFLCTASAGGIEREFAEVRPV